MANGKAKRPVGRPVKKEPITKRKFNLYKLFLEAPHIPQSPHWYPQIIEALIQRLGRRSSSEARFVKYLLRLLAICECLERLKKEHPEAPFKTICPESEGIMTFLAKDPVPKFQHWPEFVKLQRDFLLFYLEGEKCPFAARNWNEQKLWLQAHEQQIVFILDCFPCLCTYRDPISGIDTPKLTMSAGLSSKQLTCRVLANLHGSTEGGIGEYLKPSPKRLLK